MTLATSGGAKTYRFGPGAMESVWLRLHRATQGRRWGGGEGRIVARVFGHYTVYCGNGWDHTTSVEGEADGWLHQEQVPNTLDDLVVRAWNGDEQAAEALAAELVNYSLEDWFDPCEDSAEQGLTSEYPRAQNSGMSKTTLKVETPYGFTATRQTARKYSHVVVVKGQSDAYLAARDQAAIVTLGGYVAKYEKYAENARRNGGTWTEIYNGGYGRKVWTVAEAEAAAARQRDILEAAKAAPVVNNVKPHAFAWAGRYDLAVKQAAEAEKYGYVGILILEVQ